MNSIAPIWDGNETWLVLGSMGLLAAFPLAFAIIIPAVYFPILVMVLSLVFRGVAFEFRYRDREHRGFWDHGFNYGSVLATFAPGHRARRLHPGVQIEGRRVRWQPSRLLHAVLVWSASAWCSVIRLLGAGWLVLKTEGEMQSWARATGRWAVSSACARRFWSSASGRRLRTPTSAAAGSRGPTSRCWRRCRSSPQWSRDWSGAPSTADSEVRTIHRRHRACSRCRISASASACCRCGAAPADTVAGGVVAVTQAFLLIGTVFLLPIILMYTGWSYWVFRGKVRGDIGYH